MATTAAAQRSKILNRLFGASATNPDGVGAQVYVGYSASAGVECTDATYARQTVHFSASSAGSSQASDGTTAANSTAVTFPAQTAGGNVVECALFDAATTGNQISDWKAVTGGTVSLSAGQQFRIPNGSYTIALAMS